MKRVDRARDLVISTHTDAFHVAERYNAVEVWHCYILGNEKWMFALTEDGSMTDYYYEVTYNKERDEFYVDQYVKKLNQRYDNPDKEQTLETKSSDNFVDLGLPSGTLWASCNVGANSQEEFGDYKTFEEAKELGAPTREQFEELYGKCTWEWCKVNGVKGYKVTGSNGNSIFLPTAGYRSGSSLNNAGVYGYYWSGSLNTGTPYFACYLRFHSGSVHPSYSRYRYYGFSVRPVRSAQN